MIPIILGGVGWLLLLIAGATWVGRRDALEIAKRVGALEPTASVRDLADGELAAFSGHARASQPVIDPWSGEPVAAYNIEFQPANGEPTNWVEGSELPVVGPAENEPPVLVILYDGADVRVGENERVAFADAPEAASALVRGEKDDYREAPEPVGQIEHRNVPLDVEVTVVGVAKLETIDGESCVRFSAASGILFVIQSLSELKRELADDVVSIDRAIRLTAALGVVTLLIGAALLVLR